MHELHERPIYIFAGGGTGGHLYPGLAVAEELARLRPESRVVFACSNREIDRRVLAARAHAFVPQPVRPLPRGVRAWPGFLRAWRASKRLARDLVRDLRPAAVLGLGGFAAAPVVEAAAKRHVPVALLNPDAVPGKANLHLSRRVEAIFAQFERTADAFPARVRGKVRCVGCPVARRFTEADRGEAIRHFGLQAGRRTLLVLGGSLGAESINQAVAALAGDFASLADTWQLLHITGKKGSGTFSSANSEKKVPDPFSVEMEYCERMDLAYAAADLALCRGGAATVAELAVAATPAVVLPYPYHADRQQHLNAEPLAEAGTAVIVDDRVDPVANAAELRKALFPLMTNLTSLEAMRTRARLRSRPAAAQDVARWLAER